MIKRVASVVLAAVGLLGLLGVALPYSYDQLTAGVPPTTANQPLCSDSDKRASFQDASDCDLPTLSGDNTYTGSVTFGSGGGSFSKSYSVSFNVGATPSTVAANTCSISYHAVAQTGTVAGSPCIVGSTGTNNLIASCRVTTTTIVLVLCNPTTSALAPPTSATYTMRDFQ